MILDRFINAIQSFIFRLIRRDESARSRTQKSGPPTPKAPPASPQVPPAPEPLPFSSPRRFHVRVRGRVPRSAGRPWMGFQFQPNDECWVAVSNSQKVFRCVFSSG